MLGHLNLKIEIKIKSVNKCFYVQMMGSYQKNIQLFGLRLRIKIVPEDDIECESFTAIHIDSLLVYKNKQYLQVCLDNCAYKIVNKQMTDYLDESMFED